MLSTSSLLLAASTLLGLATASLNLETRQLYTPGMLNNTQEFYVTMVVTAGLAKYNIYKCTPSFLPPPSPKLKLQHS
jgi:hypothetical protein